MHAGIETVIIVLLALAQSSVSLASSIKLRSNPLGIDYSPAPSPEDGPPLSAHALRNKAYLPAEIAGICGAYVFIVSVIGIALLVVGRRLRREALRSQKPPDVEMIRPKIKTDNIYPSPISPNTGLSGHRNFSWPSPEKNEINPYVFPSQSRSPVSPGTDPSVDIRVVQQDREILQRGLEDLYAHVMEQEDAKAAGVVLTDMPLPPQIQALAPLPAAFPQRQQQTKSRLEKPKPSTLDMEKEKSHSRTSSIISSLKSPKRKGIRGMRISSPIPTPLSATFPPSYASDEEPLSPRNYEPPPPPPIPKDQVPYSHSRNNSSNNSTDPSPISPARSIAEQLAPYQQNQQRHDISQNSIRGPLTGHPPPPLSINNPSNNNSSRTLPFRAYDPPHGLASPSFSQSTKTTVLERTTPLSPGMKTPWTAGAVPYSPYQPFTPLMPITPRLVTKEDRKRMKKFEPRTPVLEMIKSEEELWDSGY